MGGMGGMGGTRSRGSSIYDYEDDMGPFSGPGGMPGGMPGSRPSTGRHSPRRSSQPGWPPREITRPLPISLEDLYQGVTKRMKASWNTPSGGVEEKVS